MQRRINSQIFGEVSFESPSFGSEQGTQAEPYQTLGVSPVSTSLLEGGETRQSDSRQMAAQAQPNGVSTQMKTLEGKQQALQTQFDEMQKLLLLKVSRLESKHQHLEDKLDQVAQEMRQRNLQLNSKVTERTFADQKMEAMVERHHQIVRGFEMKLSSLQKLIDEQEMQMGSQMSLIQDLRQELRKK